MPKLRLLEVYAITYCSEILKQKEAEIQQLKTNLEYETKKKETYKEIIKNNQTLHDKEIEQLKEVWEKQMGYLKEDVTRLEKQVEATKAILKNKMNEIANKPIGDWTKIAIFDELSDVNNQLLKLFSEGFSEKSSLGETTK